MPGIRLEDTIAAVATPSGEGGISVIRVSGCLAVEIVSKVFIPKRGVLKDFASHTLHFGEIKEKGIVLDQAVAGLFLAPHSYTGEEVVEISTHGGILVTRKILNSLIQSGARHAEPGEFTKRAFLNGRIDLTQAEAVLDIIKAKSEKSLETAMSQLGGSLSQKFKILKDKIMKIYAHLESFLDFPDEDLEIYSDKEFAEKFTEIETELQVLIDSFQRGSIFREGLRAAIVGRPNAGKSSLFNVLLARDRALVSEVPGTTRDMLEEAVEIGGFYIRLLDTAGLSVEAANLLDRMGMEKTREAVKNSDLYIYVADGSRALDAEEEKIFENLDPRKPLMAVLNKSDLGVVADFEKFKSKIKISSIVRISTKTREGINDLEESLSSLILKGKIENSREQITRLRHKNALEESLINFKRAHESFSRRESLEYAAEDVKVSLDSLRELIGEIYSEDLLDVIFAEFCIGK